MIVAGVLGTLVEVAVLIVVARVVMVGGGGALLPRARR